MPTMRLVDITHPKMASFEQCFAHPEADAVRGLIVGVMRYAIPLCLRCEYEAKGGFRVSE